VKGAWAKRVSALAAALWVGATGCTFLVDFVDKGEPDCDGGSCDDATTFAADVSLTGDATPDEAAVSPDAGPDPVDAGPDADPCNKLPDGAVCDYQTCKTCRVCAAGVCTATTKLCPQGYNWDKKNTLARCCDGLAVLTNTNANCGVCGVVCKTAGGPNEDCKSVAGHFLCAGCTTNTECWSKCCSSSPTPSHCAASDCNSGACPAGICPSPSRCVPGTGTVPNYCTYD